MGTTVWWQGLCQCLIAAFPTDLLHTGKPHPPQPSSRVLFGCIKYHYTRGDLQSVPLRQTERGRALVILINVLVSDQRVVAESIDMRVEGLARRRGEHDKQACSGVLSHDKSFLIYLFTPARVTSAVVERHVCTRATVANTCCVLHCDRSAFARPPKALQCVTFNFGFC